MTRLAAELLHAEALRVRVAAVTRGTRALFGRENSAISKRNIAAILYQSRPTERQWKMAFPVSGPYPMLVVLKRAVVQIASTP